MGMLFKHFVDTFKNRAGWWQKTTKSATIVKSADESLITQQSVSCSPYKHLCVLKISSTQSLFSAFVILGSKWKDNGNNTEPFPVKGTEDYLQ